MRRRPLVDSPREKLHQLAMKHEPGIRKITTKRKAIAAQVYALQRKDKALQAEQHKRMVFRDEAVEARRIELRDGMDREVQSITVADIGVLDLSKTEE